jgi:hypothetical protein
LALFFAAAASKVVIIVVSTRTASTLFALSYTKREISASASAQQPAFGAANTVRTLVDLNTIQMDRENLQLSRREANKSKT